MIKKVCRRIKSDVNRHNLQDDLNKLIGLGSSKCSSILGSVSASAQDV